MPKTSEMDCLTAKVASATISIERGTPIATFNFQYVGNQHQSAIFSGEYFPRSIEQMLRAAERAQWDGLQGSYVRVLSTGSRIYAVGDIMEDRWWIIVGTYHEVSTPLKMEEVRAWFDAPAGQTVKLKEDSK